MANLPIETTEEILVKLPVKDLLRFKCVCKDWLSLITSRRFIKRHYSDKSKQPCQLLRLYLKSSDEQEEQYLYCFYPMYDDNRRFLRFEEVNFHQHLPFRNDCVSELMGPINGIFCIIFDSGGLTLSNPAIRELRPLPRGPLKTQFGYPEDFVYAFGCDLSRGNLKVFALFQEFLDWDTKTACVYNAISDSWKTIEFPADVRIRSGEHHAFVNGVYYWFADYKDNTFSILAFDMRSENFQRIMIPDYVRVSRSPQLELRIVGHRNSMALHLQKYNDCRHGLDRNRCVGEMWQLDGRSMALDLCTPFGPHKFVGELWVMKREGYWRRIRRVKADWILPKEWLKTDKDGVTELAVGSDHAYKESLVSIKREEEGEDAIRALLRWCHS